ncbi:MAG: DUF507 family protein [Thermodesulfovibrionales bacterium]|nr:DUF507 family protein [Thermodesulfovibrionales bacterium]
MLSESKVNALTNKILTELLNRKLIIPKVDETTIRKEIKRTIQTELEIIRDIDASVRKKLQSFSKKSIIEGSMEWEVLYKKMYTEEEKRRGIK